MQTRFGVEHLLHLLIVFLVFRGYGAVNKSSDMDEQQGSDTRQFKVPDEHRLLHKLLGQNYEKGVRPVMNASDNVIINFGLTLIQIINMDEKNQVITLNVWLENEWFDQRIGWDPSEFGGLEMIRIPANRLWVPDIVLYNSADDFTNGYMNANAMVSKNGYIMWSPPARLRSSCKVNISLFPFDTQRCSLKFGSWSYEQAQVDMVSKRDKVELMNYVTSGEWDIVGTISVRHEVVYPIDLNAVYPDVTVTLVMRRRRLYYVMNILFPCIWLNILSLLSFCLPPDSGEKITLGITVLLSYSVFMLLVAEKMPPTSECMPIIGIYLTVSMALTSISVIGTVVILKIHYVGPYQSEVPGWLKRLCLGKRHCTCEKRVDTELTSRKTRFRSFKNQLNNGHPVDINDDINACSRLLEDYCKKNLPPVNTLPIRHIASQESLSDDDNASVAGKRGSATLEEILKCLQVLIRKRQTDDKILNITKEWRLVAIFVDKFLFYVFLFIMVLSSTVLLLIIPLSEYNFCDKKDDNQLP